MHLGWILAAGVALFAMSILPTLLDRRPLSVPLVYVAFGALVFWLVDPLVGPDPAAGSLGTAIVLYGSEIVVIISLATVGLSIERQPGLVSWSSVWRLLTVTMTISVVATAALGVTLLALPLAGALLLGAVLAPTDPVLADDVQVAAPGEDHDRDEVRFTLTAEAGLNDSLAFPVTHLAIALAVASGVTATSTGDVVVEWLLVDVVFRLTVGVIAGWVMGRLLTLAARRARSFILASNGLGVFVLGATLVVYGVTELLEGYGFLAVFVAALSRHDEIEDLRDGLHDISEQFETILVAIALITVGAAVAEGVLASISPATVLLAAITLVLVRPMAGWVGLLGSPLPSRERAAISFLGVRGLGSVFYLAYATASGAFTSTVIDQAWAVTTLVILGSIALHGFTAPLIMRHLDSKPATINRPSSSVSPHSKR